MNDPTPIRRSMVDKMRESLANPGLRAEQARQWKTENAEAIASWNEWVRKHGLPLANFRKY